MLTLLQELNRANMRCSWVLIWDGGLPMKVELLSILLYTVLLWLAYWGHVAFLQLKEIYGHTYNQETNILPSIRASIHCLFIYPTTKKHAYTNCMLPCASSVVLSIVFIFCGFSFPSLPSSPMTLYLLSSENNLNSTPPQNVVQPVLLVFLFSTWCYHTHFGWI